MNWSIFWGVTVWKLWKWRNLEIFSSEFQFPKNPRLIIQKMVHEIDQSNLTENEVFHIHKHEVINIKWKPPQDGWIKINTDGTSKIVTGIAGCGGLICNNMGGGQSSFSALSTNASSRLESGWQSHL